MNKQVKLPTSTVKKQKLQIVSADVNVPFGMPDFMDARPLQHISVTLNLSDGTEFERGFDFIPDCPIDKYIQITTSIFNQLQNDSPDSSK